MIRVSFSGQEVSLSYIWQWYQETEKTINHYKIIVINSLTSGACMQDTFLSMTKDEIIEHFTEQQEELEKLVSFNLDYQVFYQGGAKARTLKEQNSTS